jgi:anti-sigma regulatory factor (Ser/Thr protein kinase)
MFGQVCVTVTEVSQVGEARRAAVRMAEAAGLSETRCGEVGIVATELCTNLAKYSQNGRLFLQTLRPSAGVCVEMLTVDSGPGIADVQRSLRDGFSTGGSPGTGLGAIRRLSFEFDIYSSPGAGTVVLSRVGNLEQAASGRFQWSAVSTPALNESVCGDTWRVAERNGEIALMVADGLGHGPLAAEAATLAAEAFQERLFDSPGAFCERAHRALTGSRGAALAAAHVSASALRYAGVGNISGTLVSPTHSRGMFTQNGTVGLQVRKVQQMDYEWDDRAMLIMHSDGLTSRWSMDAYEGLLARHPAIVAGVLHRDCTRGKDDATIVVVRTDTRSTRSWTTN